MLIHVDLLKSENIVISFERSGTIRFILLEDKLSARSVSTYAYIHDFVMMRQFVLRLIGITSCGKGVQPESNPVCVRD